MVPSFGCSLVGRTVCAAEDPIARLYPVADDSALAVLAMGGEGVDRALETVKSVRLATDLDVHRILEFVAAGLAGFHDVLSEGCQLLTFTRGPPNKTTGLPRGRTRPICPDAGLRDDRGGEYESPDPLRTISAGTARW